MHRASPEDLEFQRAFEACEVAPEEFDHAAHVHIAYVYLTVHNVDDAARRMKDSLLAYLAHLGVSKGKYHETITRAWIMAVSHFMSRSSPCHSASEFLALNPELLDKGIMLTHYSAQVLFSPAARVAFVEPDIQAIPRT